MAKLNELLCSENTRNVGYGSCVLDPKNIVGALLYDGPKIFTAQQITDLQATLQADAANDIKSDRMFPFHNFVNVADNSEDVTITTFDYGSKAISKEGNYDLTFRFRRGAQCVLSAARTHNGDRYVLFYDKDGVIYGYDSDGSLAAIPVLFYALPMKVNTGNDTTQYLLRFIFLPQYLNEDQAFVKADFDITAIAGLQDIKVIVNSFNSNSGNINVSLQQLCGGLDLYELYSSELGVVGAWKASNGETGGGITISSVSLNGNSSTWTVQINTADPDVPDDGTILLMLQPPSNLEAKGVKGYESTVAKITVIGS